MTKLLSRAFERAAQLPETLQDELAQELLRDLEAEARWEATLAGSQDALEELADRALKEFESGRTKEMGFDEL